MSLPYKLPVRQPLPPGPWDAEPDSLELTINGFSCAIIRGPMGHLYSYVLVPKDHPVSSYAPFLEYDLSVHGGITYNQESPEGIWIGFSCAHIEDLVPTRQHYGIFPDATYRDISYVTAELTSLTSQLASYSPSVRTIDLYNIRITLEHLRPALADPTLLDDLIASIPNL